MKKLLLLGLTVLLLVSGCSKEGTGSGNADINMNGVIFATVMNEDGTNDIVVRDLKGNKISKTDTKNDSFYFFNNIDNQGYVSFYDFPDDFFGGLEMGIITTDGEITVEPTFNEMRSLGEGFTLALRDSDINEYEMHLYSIINPQGKLIEEAKYTYVSNFVDGHAVVGLEGKYALINHNAEVVMPLENDLIALGSDGIYSVTKPGGKTEFMDVEGNIVVENPYSIAKTFNEGLVAVMESYDGKVGYLNDSGALEIDFIFDDADVFVGDYATASIDGKWGVINREGAFVIQPQFDGLRLFENYVMTMDLVGDDPYNASIQVGVMDTDGNVKIEPTLQQVPTPIGDGMLLVADAYNISYSIINIETGAILFEEAIDEMSLFENGIATVKVENEFLVIDKNGESLFDTSNYDFIGEFVEGIAPVSTSSYTYGFIDQEGNFTQIDMEDDLVVGLSNFVLLNE